MKILITSGGTEEPIDDVRFVGNRSSGAAGAVLADQALARGWEVLLLHGNRALLPGSRGELSCRSFGSAMDLGELLEASIADFRPDVIVHAAAVADFTPVKIPGKLKSEGLAELVLHLLPTPKLVDRLRELAPESVLVFFKLEAVEEPEILFQRARRLLLRARGDLVVANPATALGPGRHHAWLLDQDRVLAEVETKEDLGREILEQACRLIGTGGGNG